MTHNLCLQNSITFQNKIKFFELRTIRICYIRIQNASTRKFLKYTQICMKIADTRSYAALYLLFIKIYNRFTKMRNIK